MLTHQIIEQILSLSIEQRKCIDRRHRVESIGHECESKRIGSTFESTIYRVSQDPAKVSIPNGTQ